MLLKLSSIGMQTILVSVHSFRLMWLHVWWTVQIVVVSHGIMYKEDAEQ
jgi:hypothetical protein